MICLVFLSLSDIQHYFSSLEMLQMEKKKTKLAMVGSKKKCTESFFLQL